MRDPKLRHQAILLSLASSFVDAHYPEESDLFPFVADELMKLEVGQPGHGGQAVPHALAGLPFDSDESSRLVSPYVILTLQAVLRELSAQQQTPNLAATELAIRQSAEAFGASAHLAGQLVCELSEELNRVFQGNQSLLSRADHDAKRHTTSATNATASDTPRSEMLFITRFVDGKPRKGGWCRRGVRTNNRRNPRYDFVVDEINGDVLVRQNRETACAAQPIATWIDEIDSRAAGMLWLAMVNFGGFVTFEAIHDLLIRVDAPLSAVYRPRTELGRLLGTALRDKLIGTSKDNRYPIGRGKINFCWMRETDQRSALRDRAAPGGDDETG